MMTNRTFSPIWNSQALTPEKYIEKYPELSERDETKNLRGIELIWCWYYASKESPFNHIEKTADRCVKVTEFVFEKINRDFYEDKQVKNLKDNIIPHSWYPAIQFFKTVNTNLRASAKNMLETILDQYNDIVSKSVNEFTNEKGDIDYQKFVSTKKMITGEIEQLIKDIERGYGASTFIGNSSIESEGQYYCEMYLKNKR